jgi:TRAP-type uncharacterized transport system fused permease subunit
MSEGSKGRRSVLLSVSQSLTGGIRHLIPLVLIVMTVQTEQFPVAPVWRVVVVVMVLVMDRELAQFFTVKFTSAMRTDPRKYFEGLSSIGLLQLSLGTSCHASLE